MYSGNRSADDFEKALPDAVSVWSVAVITLTPVSVVRGRLYPSREKRFSRHKERQGLSVIHIR